MGLKLDIAFKEAFKEISETKKDLPTDVLLRLYAYYKQAVKGDTLVNDEFENEPDLRDAFKFNARIQLRGMSSKEAKQEYISLVKEILE